MSNSFLVDITVPDTQLMSVDIIFPDTLMSVENVAMATTLSVDIIQNNALSVDLVAGSIKGDKGDPGGLTCSKTAGETIGGHRVVIQSSDGKVYYASSYIPEHSAKVCGITTHAATKDAQVLIQAADTLTETSWNWTPDLPIFLGDSGYLTQDEDGTGSFLLVMGVALSATSMLIDKQIALFK